MSFLLIERGNQAGQRIALTSFPITVGRDPGNTVVLNDEEVSRRHFKIKRRGRLYVLEDLESKNGTFINGDRVVNSTLQNRDKILVGNTELMFLASEPNIQISTEMVNFDIHISDELGIHGPIDIEANSPKEHFKPIRLDPAQLTQHTVKDARFVKEVYDHYENLMVIDNITEAAKSLLKSIGQSVPSASRAALFLWSETSRQLIPFASTTFKGKKPFLLSQRALEDAITRRQGVLLPLKAQTTSPGRNRIILPMSHNNAAICLIHIECDEQLSSFQPHELAIAQTIINQSAAIFESMLLRNELDVWLVSMIETMVATVEAKDTYTSGHSERVCRYSMVIADELKLNREIKKLLMISSLCHDIGKVGIPDNILKKSSHLSAEEYEEMKLHPTIGAEIVSNMPNAQRFISGVKYHHEKWNGTGYPEGLKGEDIPFFGRIIAIADGFDAMVSGRAYSGFIDQSDAIERLTEEKDLFDPEILKAFIRAYENGRLSAKTSTQNNEMMTSSKLSPLSEIKSLKNSITLNKKTKGD
jgi:HD-GYP domain-containing protein (c-di-GMP phosphodiesterase class II)